MLPRERMSGNFAFGSIKFCGLPCQGVLEMGVEHSLLEWGAICQVNKGTAEIPGLLLLLPLLLYDIFGLPFKDLLFLKITDSVSERIHFHFIPPKSKE